MNPPHQTPSRMNRSSKPQQTTATTTHQPPSTQQILPHQHHKKPHDSPDNSNHLQNTTTKPSTSSTVYHPLRGIKPTRQPPNTATYNPTPPPHKTTHHHFGLWAELQQITMKLLCIVNSKSIYTNFFSNTIIYTKTPPHKLPPQHHYQQPPTPPNKTCQKQHNITTKWNTTLYHDQLQGPTQTLLRRVGPWAARQKNHTSRPLPIATTTTHHNLQPHNTNQHLNKLIILSIS